MDNIANLNKMLHAAEIVIESQHVLASQGLNIVTALLGKKKRLKSWVHYPKNDVVDLQSGAQYYYHIHRGPDKDGIVEHGHFHTFMRNTLPEDAPKGTKPLTHIIGIGMNEFGLAQSLFTVNYWVTGGVWEDAPKTISFLDQYDIQNTQPAEIVNRWMGAMVQLYQTEIIDLLQQRDRVIAHKKQEVPGKDVLELRALEVITSVPISTETKLLDLQKMMQQAS